MTAPGGFHVGDAYVRVNAKVESRAIVAAVVGGLSVAQPAIMAATTTLFAGVGAAAVAQNDSIKRSWSKLGEDIKRGAREDASVLVPIYNTVATKLGESFQRIRPQLRGAFADAAPQVMALTAGVTEFAEHAMPGMVASVSRAGPVMDGLRDLLGDLGTSLSGFFDQLSMHPEAGAGTFRALGDVMRSLMPTVGQLLSVFSQFTAGALPAFAKGLSAGTGMLSGLLNIMSPFAGIMGTATGYVLTFVGAFKMFGLLTPILMGVSARLVTLGLQAGIATTALTGSIAAGTRVGAAFGAVANVLGRVGSALPIVGAALIGLGMIWESVSSKADQFATQVVQGSMSVQQAIAAEIAQVEANQIWWNSATQQQDAHAAARQRVTDKINGQLAAMPPLQRATVEMQMAEQAVGDAIRDHGYNSDATREAVERFRGKQVEVEEETRRVEAVTKSWSDRLVELTTNIQGVIGTNISYDGALLRIESSSKRVTDATREHGAAALETREANNQLEGAIDGAARAAQDKAAADNAGLGPTRSAEAGASAYRQELLRLAASSDGPAAAAARRLIGNLDETSLSALNADAKVAGFSWQVRTTPDGKRIVFPVDHEGKEILDLQAWIDRLPKTTYLRVLATGQWTMGELGGHPTQRLRAATGGIMPGYTPGRDVHPAMLSGGEAVMRPEWTRAVGADFIHRANRAARTGGVGGVQAFLEQGGLRHYAEGGIEPGTSPIAPNTYNSAMKQSAGSVSRALKSFGFGGAGVGAAMGFARAQVGKPYIWGATGPGGYDCSGFMSALTNILRGRSPFSRVGSTGSFPWAGFGVGAPSVFRIGSRRGNPGHMAGTLAGVNVESSGGKGPHIGPSARGADNRMFNTVAGFIRDSGGPLRSGQAAVNTSGRDEFIMPPDATAAMKAGGQVVNNFHVTIDARTVAEMNSVIELMNTVKQTARRGGTSMAGVRA